jgi:hypothetical protein
VAAEAEHLSRRIFAAQGSEGGLLLSRGEETNSQLVRVIHFSDSTVAVTRDASEQSSLAIELACLKMFLSAVSRGVLLRGAIARGLMTIDFEHAIFFGQPLVDAHELEQDQQWFGIAEHETCTGESLGTIKELGDDEIPLCEVYPVPIRRKGAPDEVRILPALNWPVYLDSLDPFKDLLGKLVPDAASPARTHADNTLHFAHEVWGKYHP